MKLRYVLFRENPNTHKEVYLSPAVGDEPEATVPTVNSPRKALQFISAKVAYNFATRKGLEWWRVGLR
jgi:hypothetical protein